MKLRKLLVTGGAGFIGANFVHYWAKKYPNDLIVVLDALTYAGNIASLDNLKQHNRFNFIKGNICDQALVEELLVKHAICTIVHFAAESHVDRSISGPDAFIETNILGTFSLLKAAKNIWLNNNKTNHRFHHVSTDEVFGTLAPDDPPFTEKTAYAPNSPYAASKASSDHLVRSYHHTYGLNVTTSNCSNNYGPYQFPEKLIPLVVSNILSDLELPVYGDGKQIRDWLFVEDHVKGIELVLAQGLPGECYNIGGLNEWANIDIVSLICQLMNDEFQDNAELTSKFPEAKSAINNSSEKLIGHVTDRQGHDRRYAIDPAKSQHELSYTPSESFETGIRKTLQWYLSNETWWRPLVKT